MATPERQSTKSPSPPLNSGEAMLKLFDSGKYSDYIVRCKGAYEFPCHKAILYARLKYFRSALELDMKEKNQGFIDLCEDSAGAVSVALKYLYSDKTDYVAADFPDMPHYFLHVVEVYALADKLMLTGLKQDAARYLDQTFSDADNLKAALETPDFLEALDIAYSSTPDTDRTMRLVFMKHMKAGVIDKLAKKGTAFRTKLREVDGLAVDLALASRRYAAEFTLYQCKACKASFEMDLEPKHCISCGNKKTGFIKNEAPA